MLRRFFILLILAGGLIFSGCQKKLFHFIVPFNQDTILPVNGDEDTWFKIVNLSATEMRAKLNVPDDGIITGVDLESISIKLVPKTGNEANMIVCTLVLGDQNSGKYIWKNKSMSLAGAETPFVGINALVEDGVSDFVNQLENILINRSTTNIRLAFLGYTEPLAQNVAMDITVRIRLTVKYTQCVEVFDFIGGDDCGEE